MKNKFEIFIENVEKLEIESNRTECYILIELAQRYYSLYCQYLNLDRARNKLKDIYELCDREVKLKDNLLNIVDRLFLDFYFRFACVKVNAKNNYIWVSQDKNAKLGDLEEDYELSKYDIGEHNLYEWIDTSCQKATEIYRTKKRFELGLDNIKEAVRLFKRYEQIKQKTEAESFNSIFSDKFVDRLITVMNTDERMLLLHIAPVRRVLCKEEQGGGEINTKALKWCFEKDFRLTASELERRINRIKQYSEIIHNFSMIDKELNRIAKIIN